MTPLAWLRNFEEALTAANINGLLERLRYVRGMGIDASVSRAIPDFRFTQFVRQGGVAPAFLLSDYSINRRRATLAAAAIDLDRSEEHTSELQSLMRISYAVFCLKKKKKTPKT